MILRLAVFIFFVPLVYAWSHTIHRAVVDDVQRQLTPKALNTLEEILGPLPLSYWADWADKTKDYPKYWHYVSWEGLTESCVGQPKNLHCALTYLMNKNDDNISSQKDRVRLLLHLVVDAHQPLHVDMKGFANIHCNVSVPKKVNLHQWMDRDAVGVRGDVFEISSWIHSVRMQTKIDQRTPRNWLLENIEHWSSIYPSFQGDVPYYCSKRSHGKLPVISQVQQDKIAEIVILRLAMASQRLAGVLNELYG